MLTVVWGKGKAPALFRNIEPCAGRPKVNVRSGRHMRHRGAESKVGNPILLQIAQQPGAFRLIRTQRDVHTSPMVKAKRTMYRRCAIGADRNRPREFGDESAGDL